eukprot:CAMPEP_0172606482 /NCGR_PEP_ID=MMETSP1068-20121228/26693_1 /TAXON_ID=35684 /ORGANISM="Pseudopedinella elastica, Strain CCMP716" /LENGTH=342 /DNA_ID=CAMNT_0013409197 /DNA_START=63 /DNA_END=1091 /DNA_ORIENTATION=+
MGCAQSTPQGGEFDDSYKILEKVGSGATATVFTAKRKRRAKPHERDVVAVKVIDKTKFTKSEVTSLAKEVGFLRECAHPNVISFLDYFDSSSAQAHLVVELVDGGELFDRISERTVYSEYDARILIRTLLDVLAYLQEQKIAHRDLKPENLLLRSRKSDSDIVLIDFGFAERVEGRNLNTQCGTPQYVAPEILASRRYGCEVDVWSCGVIAYILLAGYPPFYSEVDDPTNDVLFKKIMDVDYKFDPEWWGAVSGEAKDLVTKCLLADQARRPTARQLLRHEWFLSKRRGSDNELMERHLTKTLDKLKAWNAKRKLKGAVKAVILTNRIKNLTQSLPNVGNGV